MQSDKYCALLVTHLPLSFFVLQFVQTRNIIAWILQVLLAIMFIKADFDKRSHLDGIIKIFGGLGMPGWLGVLIGGAELLGGIGLLVPRTVRLAAPDPSLLW